MNAIADAVASAAKKMRVRHHVEGDAYFSSDQLGVIKALAAKGYEVHPEWVVDLVNEIERLKGMVMENCREVSSNGEW